MSKGPWWYGFKERLSRKQWCKGLKADNETECIKLGWWIVGRIGLEIQGRVDRVEDFSKTCYCNIRRVTL